MDCTSGLLRKIFPDWVTAQKIRDEVSSFSQTQIWSPYIIKTKNVYERTDQIEELLSEEMCKYDHLYKPSLADYKDARMASDSWRNISANVIIDGLAVLLLFDTQYYIWHFIHHKQPQLYRFMHATHHEYVAPFSWCTQLFSIPELISIGLWSNQDSILLRCHPLTTWCVTVFSIWMSVEDHIGYDLPWTLNHMVPFGLLGGAPAHDMHHQRPSSNYAPFFCHGDRIFGTAFTQRKETSRTIL
uniref:Fatty acid hydroxylase domain-containing protein n=1 Tax=Gasterosteus aculeatus aculeatus TaxID=481459 RepID=A0AAQ4RAL2_GASAC